MPGEEFRQARDGQTGDPLEDVGEPGQGIDVVELGGADQGAEDGRALAAAVGATPRSARSATLLERQMRPSWRKRVKAGQRLSM